MGLLHPLGYRAPAAEMLRHYPLATHGCDPAIPHTFWIDDEPRTAATDTEARGLGAECRNSLLLQAPLEYFPSGQTLIRRAAIWSGAKEHMTVGVH